jgi:hypothetical protein
MATSFQSEPNFGCLRAPSPLPPNADPTSVEGELRNYSGHAPELVDRFRLELEKGGLKFEAWLEEGLVSGTFDCVYMGTRLSVSVLFNLPAQRWCILLAPYRRWTRRHRAMIVVREARRLINGFVGREWSPGAITWYTRREWESKLRAQGTK